MAWFLGQSVVIIALAFVLGLLVGWLVWGRMRAMAGAAVVPVAAEPVIRAPAALEPAPLRPAVTRRAMLPEVVPDDLERIEGIGPKMAAALRRAGVHTYRQLADTSEASLREMIETAGLHFAPSLRTWARQARLLADGDEAGFSDLTRRLVAGRDIGR